MAFIEIDNLHKSYKNKHVLQGMSCSINRGEIVGIVGPNGTGKTTLLEIMMTLRKADKGRISIDGLDTVSQIDQVRRRIGIILQEGGMYAYIKVKEAIDLFGSFYGVDDIKKSQAIEMFELQEHLNTRFTKLSGGWKQRALLAVAFVFDPDILFLDEPTTGLDPQATRTLWSIIKEQGNCNKTILLSTHSMEEIDRYCDRVMIMLNGSIVEFDSPSALKVKYKKDHFEDVYFSLTENAKSRGETYA